MAMTRDGRIEGALAVVALLLTARGCTVEIPADLEIACRVDADCPAPRVCVAGLERCQSPEAPCVVAGDDGHRVADDGSPCVLESAAGVCLAGACVAAGCGDGRVDVGELCDDGPLNDDAAANACRTDCTPARCGDGVVDAREQCDDGDANADTLANACRTDCRTPSCGDFVVDDGEECDHGDNNDDHKACTLSCVLQPCDELEEPDGAGVFVSRRLGGAAGPGTLSQPFDTIGAALATGAVLIYVAEDLYEEDLVLGEGVAIDGGWLYSGAVFTRDCAPDARELTVLRASGDTGMTVSGTDVRVANLTVSTAPGGDRAAADTAGASRVGVRVVDTGALTLTNVHVVAAAAQHAGVASPGALGVGTAACTSPASCADGAEGGVGDAGADATAGTFEDDGFHPGDGALGVDGTAGTPGTTPPGPTSRSDCNTCPCVPNCYTETSGGSNYNGTATAPRGLCGCGGLPGGPGAVGRGGGASVGVLVVGSSARVTLEMSLLETGAGGDGAAGGVGGDGAPGAMGTAAQVRCHQSDCTEAGTCQCGYGDPNAGPLFASPAGGQGGAGGAGGTGGHGAGGPSYGVVVVGGGSATIDVDTTIAVGAGGASGGGSAPAGATGTRLDVPP